MARAILVATDGSEGSAGALRISRLLAQDGSRVELLAVHQPLYLYPGGYADAVTPIPPELTLAAIEALRGQAAALAARTGLGGSEVTVEIGAVAPTIARVAAQREAELIVLGLHEGGGLGRWRARETLLRLIHLAHVPVLAVPPDATTLPRTIVVGSDYSEFSVRAAHEAIREVGPGLRMHLVHVISEFTWAAGGPVLNEWAATYRVGAQHRLQELAAEFARSGEVTVQDQIRDGEPADEILKLAQEVGAELIAVGSHGLGFIGRILLGSISGRLIHQARCALLISPPQSIPKELELDMTDQELMESLGRAVGIGDAVQPAVS
jgi:nucleotide-binding universal stress UspA family protein